MKTYEGDEREWDLHPVVSKIFPKKTYLYCPLTAGAGWKKSLNFFLTLNKERVYCCGCHYLRRLFIARAGRKGKNILKNIFECETTSSYPKAKNRFDLHHHHWSAETKNVQKCYCFWWVFQPKSQQLQGSPAVTVVMSVSDITAKLLPVPCRSSLSWQWESCSSGKQHYISY